MTTTPQTQASRIFARFGGVPQLQKALARLGPEAARSLSAVYRWNLPRNKGGSAGVIPTSAVPDIQRAARLEGVMLTPDDWFPMREG